MLSYSEFSDRLLVALCDESNARLRADPNTRGQVNAHEVATAMGLSEEWLSNAVSEFATNGWITKPVAPGQGFLFEFTGQGRREAEKVKARLA